MRYRVYSPAQPVVLGLDGPMAVQAGDVVVVAVVGNLERATEVLRALNADDVRAKIQRGKK